MIIQIFHAFDFTSIVLLNSFQFINVILFLHVHMCSYLFMHFPSFSYWFIPFLTSSYIFICVATFSYMFSYLSYLFVYFHSFTERIIGNFHAKIPKGPSERITGIPSRTNDDDGNCDGIIFICSSQLPIVHHPQLRYKRWHQHTLTNKHLKRSRRGYRLEPNVKANLVLVESNVYKYSRLTLKTSAWVNSEPDGWFTCLERVEIPRPLLGQVMTWLQPHLSTQTRSRTVVVKTCPFGSNRTRVPLFLSFSTAELVDHTHGPRGRHGR